eukprot:scaffold22976_cov62-Phaeocystis_antarctica.AAC.1
MLLCCCSVLVSAHSFIPAAVHTTSRGSKLTQTGCPWSRPRVSQAFLYLSEQQATTRDLHVT